MRRMLARTAPRVAAACVAAALAAVFGWRVWSVNAAAPHIPEAHHGVGETVPLDGAYLWDKTEGTEGYSVCVKGAELQTADGYLAAHAPDAPRVGDDTDSVVTLEVQVDNVGNEDGYLDLTTMGLITPDRTSKLQCDWSLLEAAYPQMGGMSSVIKLRPDTSMTLWLPFAWSAPFTYFSGEITRYPLEDGGYQLLLSNQPTRHLVDVEVASSPDPSA